MRAVSAESALSPDPPLAISAEGLRKHFGEVRAVDGIDLAVPQGEIFAILGPNGAGKTTLMRILATLERHDAGRASIMSHDLIADPLKVRAAIAMTGQFASLDEDLTGRENLIFLARLWGFSRREARRRADDLLRDFDLSEAAARQVKDYSGGMHRRLDIAASLVVTPDVLFLDEPTTGLDPTARQKVWRMIRQLSSSGVTILLTTQYLEEADQLARRIAVVNKGRKIAEGTSRELKAETGSGFLSVTLADQRLSDAAAGILARSLGKPVQRGADDNRLSVMAETPEAAIRALSDLGDAGHHIADFSMGAPSLEDVFFALTGERAETEEME